MDARRNSGSYDRQPANYQNFDQVSPSNGRQPGGKRGSFSERAGMYYPSAQDEDIPIDHPPRNHRSNVPDEHSSRKDSRRGREPQAALHVPKSRSYVPDSATVARADLQANGHQPGLSSYASRANTHSDGHRQRPSVTIPQDRVQPHASQATPSGRDERQAERLRNDSLSHRSPLQKLETTLGGMSKGDKRARLEAAEYRAQQGTSRGHERRDHAVGGADIPAGDRSRHESDSQRRRQERDHQRTDVERRHAPARNGVPDSSHDRRHQAGLDTDPDQRSSRGYEDNGQNRFRRASEALRAHSKGPSADEPPDRSHVPGGDSRQEEYRNQGMDGPKERYYRHRSRDAGYKGAAAAAAGTGAAAALNREERHRDRRQSSDQARPAENELQRGRSKRLQKRNAPANYQTGNRDPDHIPTSQQQLQTQRAEAAAEDLQAAVKHQDPDPLPPSAVQNPRGGGPQYQVPPQTAAGQHARDQVGFGESRSSAPTHAQEGKHHHRFGDLLHRHREEQPRNREAPPALDEWRNAEAAKLTLDDFAVDEAIRGSRDDRTLQEHGSRHGRNGASRRLASDGLDGAYEEEATAFRPHLYLKCGPLLRYAGMRRERRARSGSNGIIEREIWRGSVMIVTLDSDSSYERDPTLRLFAQPMDLIPSPPSNFEDDLPPEYVDPLAGQTKISRTGELLYVKPIEQVDEGVDLSQIESDRGLFERTRSATLGTQRSVGLDGHEHPHNNTQQGSRTRARDGEKAGKYRDVKAVRLHTERGFTFWRFNLEIELGTSQARVAYRINRGPAIGFWVPGRNQTMNMMFHSCNGFSLSVDPNTFSGPDPLWRDVLNVHQFRPFHVMLGGGDQIYNDAAIRDTVHFREWILTKNPEHKHKATFSPEMQDELESFYLNRYSMWFSQGLFSMANSQIPMVNMWDDHDIIDGFGSYPHHFMSTRVFTGLGAVAFKYYMLFQHQSVVAETYREEPSWLLGASPGPYINEYSRSVFMFLGRKVAFLGLDCRTERMKDEVLSQESYDLIFSRCRAEIIKGETKHLIVLLGVPIAYPRLNFLENVLTSRVMDPVKAIGRTGALGGFVNKFDGGVEILDDLDDHWTAKHHKQERNWFIQELQQLAAEKSVRVTILGGDVHLGAVGQFYTPKKYGVPKDQDHRYMPNVISSAIVNTPPPEIMGDVLNKRNKIHHLDAETDEDMIPMFERDVDGRPRKNHHLLTRRNYCTIREYHPGSTPPSTPPREESPPPSRGSYDQRENIDNDRRYPPGSMKRSLSDNFRPSNLVRRLSGSRSRNPPVSLRHDQTQSYEDNDLVQRRFSLGRSRRASEDRDDGSYFPQGAQSQPTSRPSSAGGPVRPTNMFHRRPTLPSKAAAKGGPEGNLEGRNFGHIDLEGGLDISLNMEVSQRDPAGITIPYRLLVPALWYTGPADINTTRFKGRRASLMDRIRGRGTARRNSMSDRSYSGSESRSPSPGPRSGNLGAVPMHGEQPATGGYVSHPDLQPDVRPEQRHPDPRRDSSLASRFDGTSNRPAQAAGGHQDARKDSRGVSQVSGAPSRQVQTSGGQHDPRRGSIGASRHDDARDRPAQVTGEHHGRRDANELSQFDGAPRRPAQASVASSHGRPATNDGPAHRDYRPQAEPRPSAEYGRGSPDDYEGEEAPKKRGFFSFLRRDSARARDEGYGRERYGDDTESERRSENDDDVSITSSEWDRQQSRQQPRRSSKAEKFFGIGDEKTWGGGGGRQASGQSAATAPLGEPQGYDSGTAGKRASWKIWK